MQDVSERPIYNTIGNIYEAAKTGCSSDWLSVYKEIATLLSCGPGGLTAFVPRTMNFEVIAGTIGDEYLKQYEDYYQFVSPFRETLIKLKTGESFSRIENISNEEFEKTEIYQDLFRKQGVYHYEYHALSNTPDLKGGITFSRPKSNVSFTARERHVIELLLPHLRRGFQLHITVANSQVRHLQFAEVLSRVSQSVIVLDRSARVVFLNAAAENTIAKKDGLELDRDMQLFASSRQDNMALRAALESTFSESREDLASSQDTVQLSRPSGLRSLQLMVLPFSDPEFKRYSTDPLAMILLYDPEYHVEPVETVLSQMYGLTPAEARMAAMLARGLSLQDAGEQLNITLNTVRTHLKRIFSKTDTNRQSQLITLLNSGPGYFQTGLADTEK